MKNEIRKGVNEAKESDNGVTWLFTEIFIISVVLGIYYTSWWVFGGAIVVTMIALMIKPLRILILVLLSLACGYVGWIIGHWFDSTAASVVLSVLFALAAGGAHIWANQWLDDNS
ncbi:hypothetical protein HUB98_09315 [Paenibacillus barcinonensis]|uniref:Uncharacterized protein n=2 Tax=Paenibacillus TaxID=44249 RepID=A0A2V4VT55_PAEBA|nr:MULTISPECIES: hypothetical protein [Paenibacillus]PYE49799.1 hypothetical protein DFQ00_105303 [Paenibacillus barcinonensis]QKS56520.1 hypothetical protein HUB98_09315 [Paenibacillus barcinonensis]